MSEAIVTMGLAAMKANDDASALLASLRAILPYAESRAEDMQEACEVKWGYEPDEYTVKAVAAVDAAKALLVSLDGAHK